MNTYMSSTFVLRPLTRQSTFYSTTETSRATSVQKCYRSCAPPSRLGRYHLRCDCIGEKRSFSRKKRVIQAIRMDVDSQAPKHGTPIEEENMKPMVEVVNDLWKVNNADGVALGEALLAQLNNRIAPLESFDAENSSREELYDRLERLEEWGMMRDELRLVVTDALNQAVQKQEAEDSKEVRDAMQRIKDLEQQVENLKELRAKLAKESASELSEVRQKLESESKKHEGIQAAAKAQLNQSQQSHQKLQAEVKEKEASLHAVKMDLTNAKDALNISQEIIQEQEKMLLEARENEVELQGVVLKLQKNRQNLESMLKQKEAERAEMQQSLNSELVDLRSTMQQQVQEHERGMEHWAQEKGEYEAQVDLMRSTVESMKDQLSKAVEKGEEADEAVRVANRHLEGLRAEVKDLEEAVAAKQASIQHLESRGVQLEEELTTTRSRLDTQEELYRADSQQWEARLNTLSNERNQANAKVNVLKGQLKEESAHTEEIRQKAMLQVEAAMENVEHSRQRVQVLSQRMQGEIEAAAKSQARVARDRKRMEEEAKALGEAATSQVLEAVKERAEVMSTASDDVSEAVNLMEKHVAALQMLSHDSTESQTGTRVLRDPVGLLKAALEDGKGAFQEILLLNTKLQQRAEDAKAQAASKDSARSLEEVIAEMQGVQDMSKENEDLEAEVQQLKVTLRSLEALLGDNVASIVAENSNGGDQ